MTSSHTPAPIANAAQTGAPTATEFVEAAAGVFELTFTRAVFAVIVTVSILLALRSDRVREGSKIYLGILAGLVLIVAAFAVGVAVGRTEVGR
ncbi:hypothetical protein L0U85_03755 [Glycomyces sp. L485]|uniref:hypothetical protein n=1 Tax=Glycomyces sp. L485 TaxID=2909235 RepID=UPI001F4B00FC|nr:hypothetical protein [Glycomyces sp. L485]MCH7229977.1 hypothetical protein [Glycomyces sp. L485]